MANGMGGTGLFTGINWYKWMYFARTPFYTIAWTSSTVLTSTCFPHKPLTNIFGESEPSGVFKITSNFYCSDVESSPTIYNISRTLTPCYKYSPKPSIMFLAISVVFTPTSISRLNLRRCLRKVEYAGPFRRSAIFAARLDPPKFMSML